MNMTEHVVTLTSVDCFLRARHKAKCLARMVPFNPHSSVRRCVFIPHFANQERLHFSPNVCVETSLLKWISVAFRTSPSLDRWARSTGRATLSVRQPLCETLVTKHFLPAPAPHNSQRRKRGSERAQTPICWDCFCLRGLILGTFQQFSQLNT